MAKTGFSLQRTSRYIVSTTIGSTFMMMPINFMLFEDPLKEIIKNFVALGAINTALFSILNFVAKDFFKYNSSLILKSLVYTLKNHYIDTDYELLLKAYEHQTNYSFVLDENKIPRLKQEKHIMVPVYKSGEEKEISLLQEHIIGTKDYDLSYGSPQKKLKLAYNSI